MMSGIWKLRAMLVLGTLAALTSFFGCAGLCSYARPADNVPLPPIVERLRAQPTGEFWQQKVSGFRQQNAQLKPGGIVFCGDSITAGLADAPSFATPPIINRGIGGNGLAGLFQRLDVSAIDLRPRKLFLMIGINDIVFTEMTVDDYRAAFDYLLIDLKARCPDCTIYLQSILPMKGKYAGRNSMVLQVNRVLADLAHQHGLHYVDLHPHFTDAAGEMRTEFSADGVHPNAAGYAVWRSVIDSELKD